MIGRRAVAFDRRPVALRPVCRGEHTAGIGLSRQDFENLEQLLDGEAGVAREQALRVKQRSR